MDTSVRARNRNRARELYSSYGDLAQRLLPVARRISFHGAAGELEWSCGTDDSLPNAPRSLAGSIITGASGELQVWRVAESLIAVAIPLVMESLPMGFLVVNLPCNSPASERRLMREVAGAAAPLLDCLRRELDQQTRKGLPSATLSERTEESEWLFALTENLHSNSSEPRAISQLLGPAVERMRSSFGAVVVPHHGLELSYASMVQIDPQCPDIFERCKPCFWNFVQRRSQPLMANQETAGIHMPPFKFLVVPIEPHRGKVIGYIAFLKAASLPGFGRRQLFLGRHIGHQMGALLESPYDLATGLLTHDAFQDDVQTILASSRQATLHSVVYFDIDRLHVINDVLGLAHGDEAIVRIADLFRAPALPHDAVTSRIGGDSFAVYLPHHDADQAYSRAIQILKSAGECTIGPADRSVALSLSCGVVQFSPAQGGLSAALATAQETCAGAKQRGGNRVEMDPGLDAGQTRRRRDVFEVPKLRAALTQGNFTLYAQKIVSSSNLAEIRGIQCLVRMGDDEHASVGPAGSMAGAERRQLMHAIDHWVISNVLRAVTPFGAWLLDSQISLAIPISGQSIQDEVFVATIEKWLAESHIAPGLIVFEITEAAAISNPACAVRLIRRLRQAGCRFSLDDFGSDASSLCHLQTLPVTCVKIEGRFTSDLLSNPRSAVMVQTIVQMSKSLNMECVATCVESQPVAARLRSFGVDCVQGLLAHRPEPLLRLLDQLRDGRTATPSTNVPREATHYVR